MSECVCVCVREYVLFYLTNFDVSVCIKHHVIQLEITVGVNLTKSVR